MRLRFRINCVASIEKVVGSTGLNTGVLSAAFHKYACKSVRPEEARRAVSKGGVIFDSPGEYVAILVNHSTKCRKLGKRFGSWV
jgi:hypothetical protein